MNRTMNSTRLASLYKLAILSVGARWDLRKEPTGRIVKNENEKHISDWSFLLVSGRCCVSLVVSSFSFKVMTLR
jgi:hypothetical protein